MKFPELERSFCGACSLQTGTKIIACILLILNVYQLVLHVQGLKEWYKIEKEINKTHPEVITKGAEKPLIYGMLWLSVHSFLHIMLLLAAFKKWESVVHAWFWLACVALVVMVFFVVAQLAQGTQLSGHIMLYFAFYAMKIYFMVVVYNFYRQLKNEPAASEETRA